MYNSKSIKELIEKIEVDKELLSTMPKNNEKNIEKYKKKVDEIQKNYISQKEMIEDILNKRYHEETNIIENDEINEIDNRLQTIESVLYLLDDKTTSYEKMELDKIIYRLRKYYKENLEKVNEQISSILSKFKVIGIELQISDFNYSIYVKQYMEVLLEEYKNTAIELSDRLKNKFEEIYWKCPDIILHIELNIINIYLKNQQQIDKYFIKQKELILKKWGKTPSEIKKTYMSLLLKEQELISKDKKIILDDFLQGKLSAKDYEKEKVLNNLKKILPQEIVENIGENKQEIKKNIFKFMNSLYEYKNYEEFKFIIDDIKLYYKEKDKYKNIYNETKKQIDSNEKKLSKLNKKFKSGGWFSKKNLDMGLSKEQDTLILELNELYKKLDEARFYNKIYSEITDNSTIFEILELSKSYYQYITSCIIKNDKTITQEQIDEKIEKLNDFLKSPYNTIINNMTILQEKNIETIIRDRYKLLNFVIEKEDLQIDNVDSFIITLEQIEKSFNIEDAGLNIKTIAELVELKKLLNK